MGLPGAGKSTVAPALGRRLNWRWVDLDAEIEREAGTSIANLFQTHGEPAFRAMEARLTAALCSLTALVLAPGAGWAAQPGLLESLPPGSAVVWLRTEPEHALRRLGRSREERPLLAGADPLASLMELARLRNQRYARADLTVDVDGRAVDDIVEMIMTWLERSTS